MVFRVFLDCRIFMCRRILHRQQNKKWNIQNTKDYLRKSVRLCSPTRWKIMAVWQNRKLYGYCGMCCLTNWRISRRWNRIEYLLKQLRLKGEIENGSKGKESIWMLGKSWKLRATLRAKESHTYLRQSGSNMAWNSIHRTCFEWVGYGENIVSGFPLIADGADCLTPLYSSIIK